jgi:hypothetical protein
MGHTPGIEGVSERPYRFKATHHMLQEASDFSAPNLRFIHELNEISIKRDSSRYETSCICLSSSWKRIQTSATTKFIDNLKLIL